MGLSASVGTKTWASPRHSPHGRAELGSARPGSDPGPGKRRARASSAGPRVQFRVPTSSTLSRDGVVAAYTIGGSELMGRVHSNPCTRAAREPCSPGVSPSLDDSGLDGLPHADTTAWQDLGACQAHLSVPLTPKQAAGVVRFRRRDCPRFACTGSPGPGCRDTGAGPASFEPIRSLEEESTDRSVDHARAAAIPHFVVANVGDPEPDAYVDCLVVQLRR